MFNQRVPPTFPLHHILDLYLSSVVTQILMCHNISHIKYPGTTPIAYSIERYINNVQEQTEPRQEIALPPMKEGDNSSK